MSTSIEPTAGDLRDDAQGAFFVLETVTDLESYGGPYSNTGAPKVLRPQCVECNRRYVRLGALRCDGCANGLAVCSVARGAAAVAAAASSW